jgi:hypothetical protein
MTSIHLDDILRFRMREPLGTGGSHIRNPKFFFGLCIYFLTMYRRNLSIFFSFLELWLLKKEIKIILALKKERKNLWERSGKTWSMCQAPANMIPLSMHFQTCNEQELPEIVTGIIQPHQARILCWDSLL